MEGPVQDKFGMDSLLQTGEEQVGHGPSGLSSDTSHLRDFYLFFF